MNIGPLTDRENLIYLCREIERVAVLRERRSQQLLMESRHRAGARATMAMAMVLEEAHLAAGFGDDAAIAEAIKRLQEFK
jgi:hypothetical protein